VAAAGTVEQRGSEPVEQHGAVVTDLPPAVQYRDTTTVGQPRPEPRAPVITTQKFFMVDAC
jgi:hypothetical protein